MKNLINRGGCVNNQKKDRQEAKKIKCLEVS